MSVISSRLISASLFTLLALSVGMVSAAVSAPAPAPAMDCVQTLISLSKCLSYVMNGSNTTNPDPFCCVALQTLHAKDEQTGTQNGEVCLCDALSNRPGFGVQLNVSKVFSLTDVCVPSIPPPANCTSRFPSNVPPRAPPPENLNAGVRAFGSATSSFVALTAVVVAFFIY